MNSLKDWLHVMSKQWSWNNDKVTFLIGITVALLVTILYLITGIATINGNVIIGFSILWSGAFMCQMVLYHTIKLLVFGAVFSLVVYSKNRGNTKAISFYNEALTWRQ